MSEELIKETEHEEECCCGHDHDHEHHHHDHEHEHEHHHDHDHEHHHHHDHDEDCDCGCHDHEHHHHHHDHDHEHHHHHDEKIEVTTHEDATIATIKIALGSDKDAALVQLKSFMRAVGEEAEAEGGMVGHIKFFLKESHGEMLSMTDLDEIQIKPAAVPEYTAEGVAIIVNLDPDKLEDIVRLHYPGAI